MCNLESKQLWSRQWWDNCSFSFYISMVVVFFAGRVTSSLFYWVLLLNKMWKRFSFLVWSFVCLRFQTIQCFKRMFLKKRFSANFHKPYKLCRAMTKQLSPFCDTQFPATQILKYFFFLDFLINRFLLISIYIWSSIPDFNLNSAHQLPIIERFVRFYYHFGYK